LRSKLRALIAGLVVVSVALGLTGAGLVSGGGVVNASRELRISNVSVTGVSFSRSNSSLRINANVTLSNPSTMNLELRNVRYVMSINGLVELNATGPNTVTVRPRSTKSVAVTAVLDVNNDTVNVVNDVLASREVSVGVGIIADVPIKWFNVVQYSKITVELGGHGASNASSLLLTGLTSSEPPQSSSPNAISVDSILWETGLNSSVEFCATGVPCNTDKDVITVAVLGTLVNVTVFFDLNTFHIPWDKAFYFIVIRENLWGKPGSIIATKLFNVISDGADIGLSFYAVPTDAHWGSCSGFYVEVWGAMKDSKGNYVIDPNNRIYVTPPGGARVILLNYGMLYNVASAKWYVNGHEVTSVKSGTWVDAKVTIRAFPYLRDTTFKVCVRKDYKYWFDKNEKCITRTVTIYNYGEKTFTIHFKAEHHWLLRGYFITVEMYDGHSKPKWVMPSHYPPRLKVG